MLLTLKVKFDCFPNSYIVCHLNLVVSVQHTKHSGSLTTISDCSFDHTHYRLIRGTYFSNGSIEKKRRLIPKIIAFLSCSASHTHSAQTNFDTTVISGPPGITIKSFVIYNSKWSLS
jgi:hypothetical protein